jgi:hypothetical protein
MSALRRDGLVDITAVVCAQREDLRDAHRWLDELLSDSRLTLESLASREGKTMRSIRMTLSLAFLAPEIVKGQSKDPAHIRSLVTSPAR